MDYYREQWAKFAKGGVVEHYDPDCVCESCRPRPVTHDTLAFGTYDGKRYESVTVEPVAQPNIVGATPTEKPEEEEARTEKKPPKKR